jgi:amino acid permease
MSDSIEKDVNKLESGSQLGEHGAAQHTSNVEKKIFNYDNVDGHGDGVKRVLKARQLQMIALGGTIGTGKLNSPV